MHSLSEIAASMDALEAGESDPLGLMMAWSLAAGATVSRRCRLERLERGVLHVAAPDAGWKKEIERHNRRLLSALGDRVPSEEALPVALALSYRELQKSLTEELKTADARR